VCVYIYGFPIYIINTKINSLVYNTSVLCLGRILMTSLFLSFYVLIFGELFIGGEVLSVGGCAIIFVIIFDYLSILFIFTVRLVSCGVIMFR